MATNPKRRPSNVRRPASTTKAPGALAAPTASEAAFERLYKRFDELDGTGPDDVPLQPTAPRASEPTQLPQHEAELGDPSAPRAAQFLADLFAKRDEYLVRDRFATIGQADDFYTKIVGVSFEGRQNVVAGLRVGDALELVRDLANPHDASAVAVRYGTLHVGYLKREIARRIAPNFDAGDRYRATVGSVTGGGTRNVGVNIHVLRERASRHSGGTRAARSVGVAQHGARAAASAEQVREALIGERPLRDAQVAVLARLNAGRNTLAVLGTGRGKSLCFQLPGAERALATGAKTLVFYPLRALANDQYEALTRRLGALGLRVLRANGSIDGDERAALEAALADGSWDIVLATPEFATYHRDAFVRDCNRPQLVVVDEAHHVFESKHRPAYAALGALVRELGAPQVLALTATANDQAFADIRRTLGVDSWVIDPTVRANLHVLDARNVRDKHAYLERELGGDGKAIVYCNSRTEVTKLAERLRRRFGEAVAFYHAGIPADERTGVEALFRRGEVRVIVATSAFGEGIDLPDVRDVVLYHLNFDFTGFNQMAGRAGRDDAAARIHLLYGESDRRINDYIIARNAPSLHVLRELYRGMRGLASADTLRMTYEDVARTLDLEMADGSTVAAAVRIFEEGGLAQAGSDDDGRFVRFREVAAKVDLTKTTRFAEGQAERDAFDGFCELALSADAVTLEQIINRPIYPDGIPLIA